MNTLPNEIAEIFAEHYTKKVEIPAQNVIQENIEEEKNTTNYITNHLEKKK